MADLIITLAHRETLEDCKQKTFYRRATLPVAIQIWRKNILFYIERKRINEGGPHERTITKRKKLEHLSNYGKASDNQRPDSEAG